MEAVFIKNPYFVHCKGVSLISLQFHKRSKQKYTQWLFFRRRTTAGHARRWWIERRIHTRGSAWNRSTRYWTRTDIPSAGPRTDSRVHRVRGYFLYRFFEMILLTVCLDNGVLDKRAAIYIAHQMWRQYNCHVYFVRKNSLWYSKKCF